MEDRVRLTEQANPASAAIDEAAGEDLLRRINGEDASVAAGEQIPIRL